MDSRFPKWVRVLVGHLDFIAVPNLALLISGLAVLAFVGQNFLGASLDRFVFDPALVLQGEWYRLFAFPLTEGYRHPIWLLFFVLYVYFVVGAMESTWGSGPMTVFVLFSYLAAIAGSFLVFQPVSLWYYILLNISLAFGTIFPEMVFYIFFVLPVKAKWVAWFTGALLLFQLLVNPLLWKLFLIVVLLPYLTWFGPMGYQKLRMHLRVRTNRKRFDKDMWK